MNEGKTSYGKGKYEQAVRHYTQALHLKKNDSRALLNRSAAYLKLKNYKRAYQDASISLENSTIKNEKALFRKGKSSYHLKKFKESIDCFKMCLEINPSNDEATKEFKSSELRLEEEITGSYDFESMVDNMKKGIYENDIADFRSDLIEVKIKEDCSRGFFAKDTIEKGTLLMVTTASAITFDKDLTTRSFKSIGDDSQRISSESSQYYNLVKVLRRMHYDEDFSKEIYSLDAGKDTFFILEIIQSKITLINS